MTPTRRALFARVSRETARLTPDIARAILRAFALLASEMSEAQLAEAIASGSVERLLTRLLAPEIEARAFYPVREAIRRSVGRETRLFQRDLPRRAQAVTGTVGIGFDILNPKVIDAIRTLETRVIATLSESVRGAVRAHIELGLERGVGPRAMARGLRAVIPLAPNQVRAVANFERMLREGDRAALTRALRDHRFDRTLDRLLGVRGEGLSAEQVKRMTDAYRRNMVAFSAETNARTAALNSVKLGQRLSWQDAIDRGVVDSGSLMKRWVNVGDDRVRDEHLAQPVGVAGETVPFEETYSTGEMEPGDLAYNCRCLSFVFAG